VIDSLTCVCVCVCVCVFVCVYIYKYIYIPTCCVWVYIYIYIYIFIPTCESLSGCYGYWVSTVKIQNFCFHGHDFAVAAVCDVTTGVSVISMVTIELGLCVALQSNLFSCHGNEIS
jgi:hypothetical protein